MKLRILAVCALALAKLSLNAAERAFVQSSISNATYDASGAEIQGNTSQIFYDQHGNFARSVSTEFVGAEFFGFVYRSYDTNIFIIGKDRSSYSLIDDSTAFSNGIPYRIEHAVTTSTYTNKQFHDVTDRTVTFSEGYRSETITTSTSEASKALPSTSATPMPKPWPATRACSSWKRTRPSPPCWPANAS